VPEIQKELQRVGKEAQAVLQAMQRPDWNASSPEGLNITTHQEEIVGLRNRLQQQLLHAKAGRKIVNRLQATGHAQQLVSDEEHVMSALPAAAFVIARPLTAKVFTKPAHVEGWMRVTRDRGAEAW